MSGGRWAGDGQTSCNYTSMILSGYMCLWIYGHTFCWPTVLIHQTQTQPTWRGSSQPSYWERYYSPPKIKEWRPSPLHHGVKYLMIWRRWEWLVPEVQRNRIHITKVSYRSRGTRGEIDWWGLLLQIESSVLKIFDIASFVMLVEELSDTYLVVSLSLSLFRINLILFKKNEPITPLIPSKKIYDMTNNNQYQKTKRSKHWTTTWPSISTFTQPNCLHRNALSTRSNRIGDSRITISKLRRSKPTGYNVY